MKRMTRDVRTRRPSPTFKTSFPPTAETQLGPSGKVNAQPMLPALIALAPGPRHRPLAKMNFKTNLWLAPYPVIFSPTIFSKFSQSLYRLIHFIADFGLRNAEWKEENYKFESRIVIRNSLDLSPNFEDNWLMIYIPQSAMRNPKF